MVSQLNVDKIYNEGGDNDSGVNLATNDTVKFDIAGSTKWTMNSSGNLFPSSTSQGICFGVTSDTASNRLDDYEEGTYTPAYSAATSGGSVAYSYQTGTYTKIGRLCRVWFDFTITSASGMSGHPQINLPFTSSASGADDYGTFTPWDVDDNFTGGKHATMWINPSSSVMLMYVWAGDTNDSHAALTINATGRISGGVMYMTA